ncbi:MAG: hypothetical protein ACLU4B_06830 [Bilophila wadsworthia]
MKSNPCTGTAWAGLQWKTCRIKGSAVTSRWLTRTTTAPGPRGLPEHAPRRARPQNRKTVVVFYPLDLSMMDPKTAPALD